MAQLVSSPVDHVNRIDWRASCADKIVRRTLEVLDEVLGRLAPLIGY